MRARLGRSVPPFPTESAWFPSLPSGAAVSQVSLKYSFQGILVVLWQSRADAARSACSSRPAQHPSPRPDSAASPWPLVLLPRVGHAPWGREGSDLHAVLVAFEGTRQLEASGATAVSRRGVPEERGGPFVTFPRCSGPVPAQQPRAGSP